MRSLVDVVSQIVFQLVLPDTGAPTREEQVDVARAEPHLHLEFYLRDVTGGMRSPWTFRVDVVSKSFQDALVLVRVHGCSCLPRACRRMLNIHMSGRHVLSRHVLSRHKLSRRVLSRRGCRRAELPPRAWTKLENGRCAHSSTTTCWSRRCPMGWFGGVDSVLGDISREMRVPVPVRRQEQQRRRQRQGKGEWKTSRTCQKRNKDIECFTCGGKWHIARHCHGGSEQGVKNDGH